MTDSPVVTATAGARRDARGHWHHSGRCVRALLLLARRAAWDPTAVAEDRVCRCLSLAALGGTDPRSTTSVGWRSLAGWTRLATQAIDQIDEPYQLAVLLNRASALYESLGPEDRTAFLEPGRLACEYAARSLTLDTELRASTTRPLAVLVLRSTHRERLKEWVLFELTNGFVQGPHGGGPGSEHASRLLLMSEEGARALWPLGVVDHCEPLHGLDRRDAEATFEVAQVLAAEDATASHRNQVNTLLTMAQALV